MEYTVGSLFAGVGGIDLGLQLASHKEDRFNIIWANEIDEYAVETYKKNFSHTMYHGDIEKIVMPSRAEDPNEMIKYQQIQKDILSSQIDVLVGGFPCQAFSIAGYRKGFDDERGNLFNSIAQLINLLDEKQVKPSVLLLENVKNLKTHDKGRTYSVIKDRLKNLGYIVKEQVINTKDITMLPQNRERIYIVAFLDEEAAKNFTLFEEIDKYKIVKDEEQRKDMVKKVLDLNLPRKEFEKYYYTKEKYPSYFLTKEEYLSLEEKDKKEQRVNIDEQIEEEYQFYQVRRGMYVRKNKNGVCPTLTANMGTGGHNVPLIKVSDGVRKLTPTETFKIQGFPVGEGYSLPKSYKGRDFSDGRLYKQAGNAVSVDVIKIIGEGILVALDRATKNSGKSQV